MLLYPRGDSDTLQAAAQDIVNFETSLSKVSLIVHSYYARTNIYLHVLCVCLCETCMKTYSLYPDAIGLLDFLFGTNVALEGLHIWEHGSLVGDVYS